MGIAEFLALVCMSDREPASGGQTGPGANLVVGVLVGIEMFGGRPFSGGHAHRCDE